MTRFITLSIGFSLAFAAVAQAKPAQQENPKNKKSKPEQQQVAPKQHKAPNPQMQAKPKQSKNPTPDRPTQQRYTDVAPVQAKKPAAKPQGGGSLADGRYTVTASKAPKAPKKQERPTKAPAQQRYLDVPPDNTVVKPKKPTNQNLTTLPQGNTVVKPNKVADDKPRKDGSLNDGRYRLTAPAVQSDKVKLNKNVKTFQPRHRDFKARVNPSVASVRFNENFRIRNAENWRGHHYDVFRTYRPQWHDRGWWHSNHSHIVLIGGGWYYWNSGYWYPAWGYDDSAAYYPYDGPIYVGSSPRPFDQVVADVQSVLQEQGYYRGEVDGLVGPLTQEALAAYQSAQGLEPTAAIDQPTLESLGIS